MTLQQLAEMDCNACIVNSKDVCWVVLCGTKTNNDRVEAFYQTKMFPDDYIRSANLIYDVEANLPVEHDHLSG